MRPAHRMIPALRVDADGCTLSFEPSELAPATLYELLTTIALFPYNAAIPREEVMQVHIDETTGRFSLRGSTVSRHAPAVIEHFNRKIAEFRSVGTDFEEDLIRHAEARASRGY